MKIKHAAIGFSVFIALVIIFADLGYLRPALRVIHQFENLDKILHFLLMGTLAYLVTAALIEAFPHRSLNWIVFGTISFFLIFFTIEEVLQEPIRGRSFSFLDLAANYLGILVFGFFAWMRYRKKKSQIN